jgi:hypothetical protein
MMKFFKSFFLFVLCFLVVDIFLKVPFTPVIIGKIFCYSAVIALVYLFVTSSWWKRNILKLKN